MISSLAFLTAAVGSIGFILNMSGLIPAFYKLPVPSAVWPAMLVGGVVVCILTRHAPD
jgi:hypothetical protein